MERAWRTGTLYLLPVAPFDWRTADEGEVLSKARALEGLRLADVGLEALPRAAVRTKGEVGAAIERFFGIPANSRSEADFPMAGIELKVVPLKRSNGHLVAKERTVISMIDYHALVLETWSSAHVRTKLHILFVFFEHLEGRPKGEYPIRRVLLWRPDDRVTRLLEADWSVVQGKVRHGSAHELSEADGRIMGPCTKGADSHRRRSQPFSTILAKPRAFALKGAFTKTLFAAPPEREESLVENLGLTRLERFEQELVARFAPYLGETVGRVGDQLGVPQSGSKSYAAAIVRRIFGARSLSTEISEFMEMGLTMRITRVDRTMMPYEALSFPAFRYGELLEEDWEDSDLLARIQYMLLVPLHGRAKETPQRECLLGRPVFWRPKPEDLELISREWEHYRMEIRVGRADALQQASQTIAIHVRPHARDRTDTDIAPVVGPVVKKSFWLNRSFVRSVLLGER